MMPGLFGAMFAQLQLMVQHQYEEWFGNAQIDAFRDAPGLVNANHCRSLDLQRVPEGARSGGLIPN